MSTKVVDEKKSEKKSYDFTGKRKVFYTISIVLIALSIIVSFFGVKIAIEFKGGTMITYSFIGEINSDEAKTKVEEILGTSVNIQQGDIFQSDRKRLAISLVSNDGLTAEKQTALTTEFETIYAENEIELLDSTDVSASSGIDFFIKCIVAVAFSALILIIYIALRFKRISGWSSGICAVIALLHDVVITYGAFVAMGFEINSNFVAVVLTILGCSINNTIVVYDRIRENRTLMPVEKLEKLVNYSTTQSMSRSFRTTITTVATMIIISIVAAVSGVTSILSFSIPICIGMIIGTYSSLCLAPCLWVSWQSRSEKKSEGK